MRAKFLQRASTMGQLKSRASSVKGRGGIGARSAGSATEHVPGADVASRVGAAGGTGKVARSPGRAAVGVEAALQPDPEGDVIEPVVCPGRSDRAAAEVDVAHEPDPGEAGDRTLVTVVDAEPVADLWV